MPAGPGDLPPEVRPQVTPDLVLREVRTLGLPKVAVQVQPTGQTLINFDTIFYAQKPTFDRSITLLDYDVDITATALRYTWHHGDGTTRATTTPGAPYPAKTITHRYRETADALRPRVDVTYQIRFRVDGGEWQTIAETITAAGPAAALAVREAAPVLVD